MHLYTTYWGDCFIHPHTTIKNLDKQHLYNIFYLYFQSPPVENSPVATTLLLPWRCVKPHANRIHHLNNLNIKKNVDTDMVPEMHSKHKVIDITFLTCNAHHSRQSHWTFQLKWIACQTFNNIENKRMYDLNQIIEINKNNGRLCTAYRYCCCCHCIQNCPKCRC